MKTKRLLAAVLCLVLVLALLPATAYAADGFVTIGGTPVTLTTPYYFSAGAGSSAAVAGSPTLSDGRTWNAYLEKNNDTTYTLHLRGLHLTTHQTAIHTNTIYNLCLDLDGNNSVATILDDADAAAIWCTNLILCGSGRLTASAVNGADSHGITAASILLQYPAELTVVGKTTATSVQVTCRSGGTAAYTAMTDTGNKLGDYFSDGNVFRTHPHVIFTPENDASFPIWVDGTAVTAVNMGNVLNDASATVQYTPAAGAAPARLTLRNASIQTAYNEYPNSAGVYAKESLELSLEGSNSINLRTQSGYITTSGIFVDGPALTITAQPGASLNSWTIFSGNHSSNCYGILHDGGGAGAGSITINGGEITAVGTAYTGTEGGIKTSGSLSVTGGRLVAGGENGAVAAASLSLGSGIAILEPAGATYAPNFIRDSANSPAVSVTIGRVRHAVTYDANGGTGSMTPGTATDGVAFTLPDCGFTAPVGQQFKEWAIGSATGPRVAAKGTHIFTGPATVYAVWQSIPAASEPEPGPMGSGTVYNAERTIWLTGEGLSSIGDLLITEQNPSGSEYGALGKLANSADVWSTYSIYLRSGKRSTGSAMYLHFDLEAKYAGQAFTLVHQKADGTYEYFYATADANGDLVFGPLYELSPFMLVQGTLSYPVSVYIPKTGDSAAPALWVGIMLMAGSGLAASLVIRRKRQNG